MSRNPMAKLEVFIGTWNTTGKVLETAAGPAGTLLATDTCRWMAGQHFIIHDADARFAGKPTRSTEIIGFDAKKRRHFATSFDDQGVMESFTVDLVGRHWTIRGSSVRFHGRFNPKKSHLTGLWELRSGKTRWQPWIELELARA